MKVSELFNELKNVSYIRTRKDNRAVEYVCNLCGHVEDNYTFIMEHIFSKHMNETIPDIDPTEVV